MEEPVSLQAEDVHGFIVNYYEINGEDGNYVSSHVDSERNVVVVELKDDGEASREAFIHKVFSNSTGSTYIKYLKTHPMLEFTAE